MVQLTEVLLRGEMSGALSASQTLAHEIMGSNYFGVEKAIKHFGVIPSRHQFAVFNEVPFSENMLTACRSTHILTAVFPNSIVGLWRRFSRQNMFYSQDYSDQSFANHSGKAGWQLVCKTPVAGSMSKTWREQQDLLAYDEETPTAQFMVYTMIGYFLATGERLFNGSWVRCWDRDSDGCHVDTGHFDLEGIQVYGWNNDLCHSQLGIASVKKKGIVQFLG